VIAQPPLGDKLPHQLLACPIGVKVRPYR
jgi:hypothetical protein